MPRPRHGRTSSSCITPSPRPTTRASSKHRQYIAGIASIRGRDRAIPERCDRLRHRGADQGSLRAARRALRSRRRNFSFRILARRLRGAQPGRLHHPLRGCQSKGGLSLSTRRGRSIARRLGDARRPLLAELRSASHYPVRIKCIGVWDTVGNIGNPFYSGGFIGRMFKFHDMRLADTIDVALHALAIDEMRGPFRPIAVVHAEGSSAFPTISTSSRSGSPAATAMSAGAFARRRCPTWRCCGWLSA